MKKRARYRTTYPVRDISSRAQGAAADIEKALARMGVHQQLALMGKREFINRLARIIKRHMRVVLPTRQEETTCPSK